ncbi:SCO family protein [Xylophilus sp. GOD-11R]|uniref:SCO family protein n=1 Tax=Xylophilus sp. GOD-11R TaxID=3089814 RepID=UPI00298C52A9|nr:SCO family protein [Xylophilus sp. GOD-11R]WPB55470.1 SCO family protein [Xylophilus sp. GOD-11R]
MTEPHVDLHLRRTLLGTAALLLGSGTGSVAQAHNVSGPVSPPLSVPARTLRMHDGRPLAASALLQGRITALQLMFTGCSAICPIQGALFAELDRRVSASPALAGDVQLLSLSIDPLGDDPKALSAWLKRFDAGPRWKAASPPVPELDAWLDFLQGRRAGPDRHTAQVYLFDRKSRLVLRTVDYPTTAELTRLLGELATSGA